jgi:hypothetical protein
MCGKKSFGISVGPVLFIGYRDLGLQELPGPLRCHEHYLVQNLQQAVSVLIAHLLHQVGVALLLLKIINGKT